MTGPEPIDAAIDEYADRAGRRGEGAAPYNSESLAEIYGSRVRQLFDLQAQGFTHAEWKWDDQAGENRWHGVTAENTPNSGAPSSDPTDSEPFDGAPHTSESAPTDATGRTLATPPDVDTPPPNTDPVPSAVTLPEGMTADRLRRIAWYLDWADAMLLNSGVIEKARPERFTDDDVATVIAVIEGDGMQEALRGWADAIEAAGTEEA